MDKTTNENWTDLIGIPGLTITGGPDQDGALHGEYISADPPRCENCHIKASGYDFAPEREVKDLPDNADIPVTVIISERRYECPRCKSLIPNEARIGPKGCGYTYRLEEHIGKLCLDNSFGKVVRMHDDKISKTTVERIFDGWARRKIGNYINSIVAPHYLGMHILTLEGRRYLALTDIENKYVLDITELGDYDTLQRVRTQTNPALVMSEVTNDCLIVARGTFGQRTLPYICVSAGSAYRLCAKEISILVDDFRVSNAGKRRLREYLLSSLINTSPVDLLALDKDLNQLTTHSSNEYDLYMHVLSFKDAIQNRWNSQSFDRWFDESKTHSELSECCSVMENAYTEIQQSFSYIDRNSDYEDVHEKMKEIIGRCKKCTPMGIRSRILLSFPPVSPPAKRGTFTYGFAGVSIQTLYDSLPTFNA